MKNFLKSLALTSAIIAGTLAFQPVAAKADSAGWVTVINGFNGYDDSYRISWVYFQPEDGGPSRNILQGVIHPGHSRNLRLGWTGFSCVNDIEVKLHNGLVYNYYGVDVCGTNSFSVP